MAMKDVILPQAWKAGRYYASEALRNPKNQQYLINKGIDLAKPAISKVTQEALFDLSTKIRPKRADKRQTHKTDIKGIDYTRGGSLIDSAIKSGVAGSPWQVDLKKGKEIITDPNLFKFPNTSEIKDAKERVKVYKQLYEIAKKKRVQKIL